MSDDDAVTKVGSWVPEIYYDIIARVVPGCLTLLGITCLVALAGYTSALPSMKEWKDMSWIAGGFTALTILGCGYILGHLITPFGRPVFGLLTHRATKTIRFSLLQCLRIRWLSLGSVISIVVGSLNGYLRRVGARHCEYAILQAHSRVIQKAISSVPAALMPPGTAWISHVAKTGTIRPKDSYSLDHFLHEYIRLACPQAVGIITKMRAEVACCRNLTAASVALLLVDLCLLALHAFRGMWLSSAAVAIVPIVTLMVLASSAAVYRQGAYYARIIAFLYLIHRRIPVARARAMDQVNSAQPDEATAALR